jgi:hypothetical protein
VRLIAVAAIHRIGVRRLLQFRGDSASSSRKHFGEVAPSHAFHNLRAGARLEIVTSMLAEVRASGQVVLALIISRPWAPREDLLSP